MSEPIQCRKQPCSTCPYRQDVPSGLWAADEYRKLPEYDNATGEQPIQAFFCHTAPDFLCTGWAACHSRRDRSQDLLALRFITSMTQQRVVIPKVTIPLFASGEEAALHGLRDINRPKKSARDAVEKIEKMRARRGKKEKP